MQEGVSGGTGRRSGCHLHGLYMAVAHYMEQPTLDGTPLVLPEGLEESMQAGLFSGVH